MFRVLKAAILCVAPTLAFAQCDFATSQYAKELQEPQSVKGIEIEVNKSKKWAVNGIRMIIDNQQNIHPKWKKKFSATVRVSYPFGTCTHPADIRQSGDWRDHTEFANGKLRQSLDVELEAGNIANTIKFKLFLPETRLGNNETLATLILRKLDILAPKTFTVNVTVNGVEGSYLFQEKESKELLEAMGRREGPMFEGDEALLWSYEDFENFELELVSGARLVNKKWARRGDSSALMAFNAFQELQHNYVSLSARGMSSEVTHYLDPNARLKASQTFPEYHAMVGAIHGMHALRGHNRKYYWNALAGEFEPLYYDGNVTFEGFDPAGTFGLALREVAFFKHHLKSVDFANLKSRVAELLDDDFMREFAELAKLPMDAAKKFAEPKFNQVLTNLDAWAAFVTDARSVDVPAIDYPLARDEFVNRSQEFGVEQQFVVPRNNDHAGFGFDCVSYPSCDIRLLDVEQVVELMSDQQYKDERIIILPEGPFAGGQGLHEETETDIATVRHSAGAQVSYESASRELKLLQSRADDWFLIKNASLKDVTVSLTGLPPLSGQTGGQQRFNEFGLTGCLTLYKVEFENADIAVTDGGCEDSLNLVSSVGTINTLSIVNGFADAIDLDFSDIEIGRVFVDRAGNDCLDVSGGVYVFEEANLTECGDKGISVGESSYMIGGKVIIDTALIGASSKDYSFLAVQQFSASSVHSCLEAFQKKEEFGGATIEIATDNCDRTHIARDENSSILLGGVRFELSN